MGAVMSLVHSVSSTCPEKPVVMAAWLEWERSEGGVVASCVSALDIAAAAAYRCGPIITQLTSIDAVNLAVLSEIGLIIISSY